MYALASQGWRDHRARAKRGRQVAAQATKGRERAGKADSEEEELEGVADEVTGHFAIGHLAAPSLTRLPHVCVCVCNISELASSVLTCG